MKKSNKVLLYGLLASILLILFCLYTHQDMFMNQKKESLSEFENRDISQDNDFKSSKENIETNEVLEEVELQKPKKKQVHVPVNNATVEETEVLVDENKTENEANTSAAVDTNASNSTVIRTIFKNKEEIKLKEHPKVKPKKEKVNVVDANLPIEDNKPLVDNDKKVSEVTATVQKKEKVEAKKVPKKPKLTQKKREKVSTSTKSLSTLQEEISNITNRNISFYKSKAQLTNKSRATLDKVIKILKTVPNAKIVVKGYTDASGKEKTNLWISQERAKSVRRYLAKHGIPLKNIVAKGYGESELLYGDKPNSELNRRVEIEIKRK